MEKENINKNISKEPSNGWIQRLKEESWEAELLVSAIAIFGTFKLFDIVSWATNFFIDVLNPNQYFIAYFIVTFGLLAVSMLAVMFVIHFVLRAYWIGLVGLNSVFPDYSIEDSVYSKIYTKKILEVLPKLKESIQKTDELCSVIFSAAFTLLFMYAYMSLFASVYLFVYNLLSKYIASYILLIPAGFFTFCLFLQMIITLISNLKVNKEKEKIQTITFKINKFVSMLTFGPLYKSILQITMIFGSNFKKKKSLVYLVLSFVFVGLFLTMNQIIKTNIFYLVSHQKYFNTTKVYASFYKDENKTNTFLLTPEIESDKVTSDVLKIFIPVFSYEKNVRTQLCGTLEKEDDKSFELAREEMDAFTLNCYKEYYHIYIDNEKITADFLRQHGHSRTKQAGIISYLDISNLKKGIHTIKVRKELKNSETLKWKIKFYKVTNN